MRKTFVLLSVVSLFVSCSSDDASKKYLQCGEVEYVSDFPKVFEIKALERLDLDLTGCVNFFIADTLLVCEYPEKDLYWEVHSLNDLSLKGRIISKGHGHNEFSNMPTSIDTDVKRDSGIYCNLFCSEDKFYQCNISESLEDTVSSLREFHVKAKLGDASSINEISDSEYFILNYMGQGYKRMLLKNGTVKELENIGNLNDVRMKKDINVVSSVRCFNKQDRLVAEAMLRLNQINLYSLDGKPGKTLCVGDEQMSLTEADETPKSSSNKMFGCIQACGDFFVAAYHDIYYNDYFEGKGKTNLMFFDWQGSPLLRINMPFVATSFAVSDDMVVYLLESNTKNEAVYKYDLKNEMAYLKNI